MLKYRVGYTIGGMAQSVHFARLEAANDFIEMFPEGTECEVFEQSETKLKTIKVTAEWKENWNKTKVELMKHHEAKGAIDGHNSNSKQIEAKG